MLEVHRGEEKFYFQYAAALSKKQYEQTNGELLAIVQSLPSTVQRQISKHIHVSDKVICVIFELQQDTHLISYGGYFEVKPQALYRYKGQVNNVLKEIKDTSAKCLSMYLCDYCPFFTFIKIYFICVGLAGRNQLGILGMANKMLNSFDEYYAHGDFALLCSLSNDKTRNFLMSKNNNNLLCEEEIVLTDDEDNAGTTNGSANKTADSLQTFQENFSPRVCSH